MALYVISPCVCLCTCLCNYVSVVSLSTRLCIYVSVYLSIISVSLLHPSVQTVMEPRTFWGESWLGPSVKLLQGERAVPLGAASLPSWRPAFPRAQKLPRAVPSGSGSVTCPCANSGGKLPSKCKTVPVDREARRAEGVGRRGFRKRPCWLLETQPLCVTSREAMGTPCGPQRTFLGCPSQAARPGHRRAWTSAGGLAAGPPRLPALGSCAALVFHHRAFTHLGGGVRRLSVEMHTSEPGTSSVCAGSLLRALSCRQVSSHVPRGSDLPVFSCK